LKRLELKVELASVVGGVYQLVKIFGRRALNRRRGCQNSRFLVEIGGVGDSLIILGRS
jgi:hypothetical protein